MSIKWGFCFNPFGLLRTHIAVMSHGHHRQLRCLLKCLSKRKLKENIIAPRYWSIVRGDQWPVDSLHMGPVMRKCFRVIMVMASSIRKGTWPSVCLYVPSAGSGMTGNQSRLFVKFIWLFIILNSLRGREAIIQNNRQIPRHIWSCDRSNHLAISYHM